MPAATGRKMRFAGTTVLKVLTAVFSAAFAAAFGVTKFTGWGRADPVFALAIAGYMLWNSRGIANDVLKQLLDHELSNEDRQRIKEKVLSCGDVQGLHDLRTGRSGDRTFVEFHLEVNGHLTIDRGHAISDVSPN
jgi:ferrous-iron efflux pump FieF